MSDKEFHGYAKCDCCLKEDTWCDSVKPQFKMEGIFNVCESCGSKVNSPVDFYGVKTTAQIWEVRCIANGIRHSTEINIEKAKRAKSKKTKWRSFIHRLLLIKPKNKE